MIRIKVGLFLAALILMVGLIMFIPLFSSNSRLGKWATATFRPPLRSDNVNETLKLNRLLANPLVVILIIVTADIAAFYLFNFAINTLKSLPALLKLSLSGEAVDLNNYINPSSWQMHLAGASYLVKALYGAFFIGMIATDLRMAYMIRLSYSDMAINKGNSGTARWTTLKEVMRQYKEIDMYPVKHDEPTWFKGRGGVPVMRWRNKLYIDTQLTNNLFLGATRSGKGELFVFALIDIFSRALKQTLRPSMIIFDPKIELYKSSVYIKTLEKRGYIVDLINLDNPMKSAGYNPLAIIADYYKRGKVDEAQQLTKSFAFGIFNNSSAASTDPIWPTTATDLWTAMIIAVVSDCIEADSILNADRVRRYNELRQRFDQLPEENYTEKEIDERREIFAEFYRNLGEGEDYLDEATSCELRDSGIFIPDYIVDYDEDGVYQEIPIEYKEIYPNEKNINCFSVLSFFRELVGTYSESTGKEAEAGAKKAETALDDYFNARSEKNPLDFANALYSEIKEAGDRTKGSVYITMQSALSIFMQENIARLTAESDIDIASIGFDKEHPHAIFISIPTEDKANHFLALTFVTQVFQHLWKLSKEGANKLDREVQFILDEFGNMPVFDNFDGMVTNCLGAGMAFNIFIQSYNQLHSKYEMDMDTIKDNFANQFYILAVGQESKNEFSEQLGNKTVIDVQRSGTLLSMQKNLMENTKERPLLYPEEIGRLREGETALIRASKRTDRAGASIESFPLLCEYQDNMYFWWYIIVFVQKIILKRILGRDKMKDRDTGEDLTISQEYRYWISQKKRWLGTAFLYRWQYATKAFPNPTSINFNEVFTDGGREKIDYVSRVVDINEVLRKIGIERDEPMPLYSSNEKPVCALASGVQSQYTNLCASYLGPDFKEKIGLSDDMTVGEVLQRIDEYIEEDPRNDLNKSRIITEDFMGKLVAAIRK